MDNNLKPCPFCGGEGKLQTTSLGTKKIPAHWVRCVLCLGETAVYVTEDEAVSAWNRRTNDKS